MSHDRWLESAAAYALDSLDRGEHAEFEVHLTACAECRLAVHEYREVAGLLMHASEPAEAPPGLRERVGRRLGAERAMRQRPARRPWRSSAIWLAAAGVAFAAAAGVLWREATNERRAAIAARDDLARAVATRDSLLQNLRGSRVHVVSLAAPDGGAPVARVFWNHERQRFVVTAFRLPPAGSGRTYQLWALAAGRAPVSMGTFDTDSSGVATVVLPVSQEVDSLGFIEGCGLTEEPAGGSSAPTEAPRFVGSWRHTD
jgi:anti-sigma-K factor RskA